MTNKYITRWIRCLNCSKLLQIKGKVISIEIIPKPRGRQSILSCPSCAFSIYSAITSSYDIANLWIPEIDTKSWWFRIDTLIESKL